MKWAKHLLTCLFENFKRAGNWDEGGECPLLPLNDALTYLMSATCFSSILTSLHVPWMGKFSPLKIFASCLGGEN